MLPLLSKIFIILLLLDKIFNDLIVRMREKETACVALFSELNSSSFQTAFYFYHYHAIFRFSDSPCDMPHFSNELLVSQRAHVEKLTFSYYLRHGRPSFAFVSFVGENLKEATVSKAR